MSAELLDHGQELTLRVRRGADLVFTLTLTDELDVAIDITGATIVGRIFADKLAEVQFSSSVDGPAGKITLTVSATRTRQMAAAYRYNMGFTLGGITKALIFGNFYVDQEFLA